MRKVCKNRFRSSCACARYHTALCSVHKLWVSNCVSGQWRPWSGCAIEQADLGLRCPHMPETHFRITKTYLYNFDPHKPHFYIIKLGFTEVYIIFLISAQKHRLWVLVRTASPSTHNLCFGQKYEKYQNFYLKIFILLVIKFSIYLNRLVFVMAWCRPVLN